MKLKATILISLLFLISSKADGAAVRLKDIANVQGVRENILIGYGLVVGLKGTGDTGATFTAKSLSRMLQKFGVSTDAAEVRSQNVAAVVVTAQLGSFSRAGNKLDVTVSSIGDAASLEGGTLIATPLMAGDKNVYAVAQGPVSTGGKNSEGISTIARVTNGAVVEREIPSNFENKKGFRLALKNADFTTAARTAKAINQHLGGKFAQAKDSATVDVIVPFGYSGNTVELMALIEGIRVNADTIAKVVMNERTGTIVAGENVKISTVALSHGDLVVEVKDDTGGRQVAAAGNKKKGEGEGNSLNKLESNASVGDLAKSLNALGVKPKDLISIFQTLKASGALKAELEFL
jgi:flagellar P-ring protein precursor FlgI